MAQVPAREPKVVPSFTATQLTCFPPHRALTQTLQHNAHIATLGFSSLSLPHIFLPFTLQPLAIVMVPSTTISRCHDWIRDQRLVMQCRRSFVTEEPSIGAGLEYRRDFDESDPTQIKSTAADSVNGTDAEDDARSIATALEYSKEPLRTFKSKVVQLASHLFPGIDIKNVRCTYIASGRFNQFYILGVPTKLNRRRRQPSQHRCYILRIPRSSNHRILHTIAASAHATALTGVRTPRIVDYNATELNTLGVPYILLNYQPGVNLTNVLKHLNYRQRLSLAKEVAGLILSFQATTQTYNSTNSNFPLTADWKISQGAPGNVSPPKSATLQFIMDFCKLWKEAECGYMFETRPYCDGLTDMAKEIHRRGLLPDSDQFHFTHFALHPSHLLVELGKASVKIVGVFGLEDSACVPKYMACRPPAWL